MSRTEHEFTFAAEQIADAAKAEAEYHEERLAFWRVELSSSISEVRETASIKVKEFPITGGKRIDLAIDYGDGSAYRRMNEAQQKIDQHHAAAERFRTDERVYRTQAGDGNGHPSRNYELTTEDVHHFRLGGGDRDA